MVVRFVVMDGSHQCYRRYWLWLLMLWCFFFFGVGSNIGCSVCLSFFFLVVVADIGGQWLICGGGWWLWAVAIIS